MHLLFSERRIVYFFIDSLMLFFKKTYVFEYLQESPRRGDSNKYTKRMIHKKKLFKSIRYSCFRRVHIKFLYNSKFDLTAKSLLINTVVITRVLCIFLKSTVCSYCCNLFPQRAEHSSEERKLVVEICFP